MATVKISELPAILGANTASTDVIPIVDVSGNITNKITRAEFFKNIQSDVEITDKIVHSGDTNTAIRFPAADTVTVETSGAERLRVDSLGRVGIGVTNPAVRFQVAAQSSSSSTVIAATEVDYTANFRSSQLGYHPVDTTGTTLGFSNSNLGALSFLNTTNAVIGTNGATPLAFATTNLERMRITSAGNVGIGTSSPGQALSIVRSGATAAALGIRNNTGDASIFMTGQDTGITNIAFGDQTLFDAGFISYAHTSDVMSIKSEATLVFRTGASERMRLDASGNLGVGETVPDYKLDVNGAIGFAPGASVTPVDNGDVVFELTNNTTLTIKAKGSDGVVRSATITLA